MKGLALPDQYTPRTVPALLADRAATRSSSPAICAKVVGGGYETLTFGELCHQARQVAAGLRELGVASGDRVAWICDNSGGLDAAVLYHAVLWVGGINVPVNSRLVAPEVSDIVSRSGSRMLILDPAFMDRVGEVSDGVAIVTVGQLSRWAATSASVGSSATIVDTTPAAILYTSGTTGRPKGVVHTHGSSIAAAIGWSEAFALNHTDVLQSPFPIFTGAGLHFNGLSCLWAGAEFVIDDYDANYSLGLIQERRTSVYVAVPSIYAYWLDNPAFEAGRLSSLRLLDFGGAAMAPALIEALGQRLPAVGLMQSYGLTEAGPGGTYLPPELAVSRLGSIGDRCAGAFTSVRVVDRDGQDVRPGGEGELLIRGPSVMEEYFDDPIATEAAFDGEWLRSGDVVRVDDDGYMYVVDRIKDIIVRGGFNISSAEVEAALVDHGDVVEAAVIAVKHERLGEDVHAFVVLRPGSMVDSEVLRAHVMRRLASFKCPRAITFVSSLPRNAAGKVLKQDLRAAMASPLSRRT